MAVSTGGARQVPRGGTPRPALPRIPADVSVHAEFRSLPPPVLLVGMHRGGTSLTALMLGRMGLFLGPEAAALLTLPGETPPPARIRDGYAEAEDFRLVNDSLLAAAGSDWCSVDAFLQRRQAPEFARAAPRLITRALAGKVRRRFLHPLRSLPRAERAGTPWGWKDPRTSLTLPFWLALFPGARVIHVRRDPEAAARSLNRRSRLWMDGLPARTAPPAPLLVRALRNPVGAARALARRLLPRPAAAAHRDLCVDLDYARALCHRYEQECLRYRGAAAEALEIWYEDLLSGPEAAARRLGEFTGLDPSAEALHTAASAVRRERGTGATLW